MIGLHDRLESYERAEMSPLGFAAPSDMTATTITTPPRIVMRFNGRAPWCRAYPHLTDLTIFLSSSPRFSRDSRYSIVIRWFGLRNRATDAPVATRARSSTSSVACDPTAEPAFDASHFACRTARPAGPAKKEAAALGPSDHPDAGLQPMTESSSCGSGAPDYP